MVVDGHTGILVPPGNAGEIARALQVLASDVALRQRMGVAARCQAESEHDATANWRRIFDLMTLAAGRNRAADDDAVLTPGAA
jgi:glycosyltransferase involved in cell wall biosynthesis